MILYSSFFDVFKVYLSNIDSETAGKREKKGDFEIWGAGAALYYDLKYTRYTSSKGFIFSRMPITCKYCFPFM